MRYMKVEDLREGMILANTIYDTNGSVLLRSTTQMSANLIRRLEELKYSGIYIHDEHSKDVAIKEIVPEAVRIKSVQALKSLDVDGCRFCATKIVDELDNCRNLVLDMLNVSSYDDYAFNHSINVAIIAATIGLGLGLPNRAIEDITTAALLHDIGKTKLDKEILKKNIEDLTGPELVEFRKYPIYSYDAIKNNPAMSAYVKNAIYAHCEHENGTGFPRAVSGDKIHLYAKIIRVADEYDTLTSARSGKESMNAADAIEYLIAHSGILFDMQVVQTFMQYVAPYPVGIEVELSSGQKGIVQENFSGMLSRPTVLLEDGTLLNLQNVLDITIVNSTM